ncbi:hypothetical protein Cni_G05976 [Canna indica]|uniref:Peptidase A1 domain-containing protein n=1 Tax=Canna indica TaxID=4628 RepID=A0AAQ3Q4B3_9LILI|nr:hypothetical protein Cni_G05976 [Canna indica]
MASLSAILVFFCLLLLPFFSSASLFNLSSLGTTSRSTLHGIELPAAHLSFDAAGESNCHHEVDVGRPSDDAAPVLKLHLKHRSTRDDAAAAERTKKKALENSTDADLLRIRTLLRRVTERKNRNAFSRRAAGHRRAVAEIGRAVTAPAPELAGRLMANVESGVTLGSGEYFIDVFVGTPPRHFSLILDTGSDLNWLQCLPCYDCFEQHGPVYDPAASSSYRNVSCADRRCDLVSSPDPPRPCNATADPHGAGQPCPYFYWYGDRSNTTGDLALETFTMNLTAPPNGTTGSDFGRVHDVIFGCGHWNRGLFHGAAGLLGLGRGPLSFSSQLGSLYGHIFSYCLVDRNSDLSVSSKLIFGEDQSLLRRLPNLNYTSLVSGKENSVETFYYVQIKSIIVGGEALRIPPETWELAKDGSGGTIIDSGTTLSYFTEAAFNKIKEAFVRKVNTKYPVVEDFPVLSPCYNVSGVEKVELPEFAILFGDGAVWNFPVANYFIRLEEEEIMCLAMLPMPQSALSILGNYQQQNFYISYDMKNSRLGFAPTRCADM